MWTKFPGSQLTIEEEHRKILNQEINKPRIERGSARQHYCLIHDHKRANKNEVGILFSFTITRDRYYYCHFYFNIENHGLYIIFILILEKIK